MPKDWSLWFEEDGCDLFSGRISIVLGQVLDEPGTRVGRSSQRSAFKSSAMVVRKNYPPYFLVNGLAR